MNGIERPLDLLNQCKGHDVLVYLKDKDRPVEGKLCAFDIHINLVLDVPGNSPVFVRGDVVETVVPKHKKNGK